MARVECARRPEREVVSNREPYPIQTTEPEIEFDYDADLEISLDFLHLECQEHSKLAMKYSKAFAKAKRTASLLDEKIKTLRSQLLKDAKEKGISSADLREAHYRDHDDYKAAKQEWIDAVYIMDLLEGAKYQFSARKSMLEEEVKLHGQEYYSTPQIENLTEAVKQFAELKARETENRIHNRLRR